MQCRVLQTHSYSNLHFFTCSYEFWPRAFSIKGICEGLLPVIVINTYMIWYFNLTSSLSSGHFKECCLRAHEKVSKFIKAHSWTSKTLLPSQQQQQPNTQLWNPIWLVNVECCHITSTQNKEYVLYIVAKIISLRQFSVSRTILRKEKYIYTVWT